MVENFVNLPEPPAGEKELYGILKDVLAGGVIYHCGPVVKKTGGDQASGLPGGVKYEFVAAGPTTSIREEPYQADVMDHFQVRGVIGKGGMGPKTLAGLQKVGACYFHAIGGAATLIAKCCRRVTEVHKMEEFGTPEAFWVLEVKDFPLVVTMDSHGESLHEKVLAASQEARRRLK